MPTRAAALALAAIVLACSPDRDRRAAIDPASVNVPVHFVRAIPADSFVSSIGVATHFNYYDFRPYGVDRAKTIATLESSGIRFIRDGLNVDANAGANDEYWGTMKELVRAGLKLILVTQPAYLGDQKWVAAPYANQSNLDTAVARVGAAGILAWEGPNEVDNNNVAWGGWSMFAENAKKYQQAMYAHAHAIAPGVPVLGFTTTSAKGSAPVGDISPYMDFANMHPYPNGGTPSSEIANMQRALAPLNGAHKPWWATEAGYYTSPGATETVFQPGVSERAQSRYVPRLYLDFFSRGISHTAAYELVDEKDDWSNAEWNFGLLRNDGKPKPAFTALTSMIAILRDPDPPIDAGGLIYAIRNVPSTVRSLLLGKRGNVMYLVLWNDVPSYSQDDIRLLRFKIKWRKLTHTGGVAHDIDVAPVHATIALGIAPRLVLSYAPVLHGMEPTSLRADTTIDLEIPDHPVILAIWPAFPGR